RPIRFRVSLTLSSGSRLRKGDWESCTERPCLSVSSKTGPPVVLTKSARTMESFSVSVVAERERQQRPPATKPTTISTAAGTRIFEGFLLAATGTSVTFASLDDGDGVRVAEELDARAGRGAAT